MRKILAVGDIHGCDRAAERALALLEEASLPVVFLGDYVDRGPSTVRTVELLIRAAERHPDWKFLCGNHEHLLLETLRSGARHYGRFGPVDGYDEYHSIGGLPQAHEAFLSSLLPYHESQSFLFVHGGISREPERPAAEHPIEELVWTYDVTPEWKGKKIVRGHMVVPHAGDMGNHINLDTGCYYYGWLTIGVLDDETGRLVEVIQVSIDGKQVRREEPSMPVVAA